MKLLFIALLLAISSQTFADQIQLNVQGSIYSNTCEVDSASQNLTVDLGNANASDFRRIGDASNWVPFDLTLSKCPPDKVTAFATFLGKADSALETKFANTGTAKGLAMDISIRGTSNIFGPNTSLITQINAATHTADMQLAARYFATSVPVQGGSFNSVVQVTFVYQ